MSVAISSTAPSTQRRRSSGTGLFPAAQQQVEVVASTDAKVPLLKETGAGKERRPRDIHDPSSWRERAFVKINCAASPSGLLESELFGHEKGAFAGAIAQKIGRFELASGGTLKVLIARTP